MAFVARMALLMMVCVACAAATTAPPDEAAVKRWAAAHPAVEVVLDDQLGGEVAGGEANPLVTEYLKLASRNTGVKFETFKVKSWAEAVKAAGRVTTGLVDDRSAGSGADPIDYSATFDGADPANSNHPVFRTRRVAYAKKARRAHLSVVPDETTSAEPEQD